ncbi:hypothetical protein L9F63_015909, partial [Diploptera punctata]
GKRKIKKTVSVLKIGKKKTKRLQLKSALKKCLIIKNLSYKATEKDLEEYLHTFGKICKVELLKKRDGSSTGRGVVEFTKSKAAAAALDSSNGKEFMGRKIVIDWIPLEPSKKIKLENKSEDSLAVKEEKQKEEGTEEDGTVKRKTKENKKIKGLKKGRLIVRNLPFRITEAELKEHFKKFGEITEVSLLRRADGKLVGCGFVQFVNKNCAAKAILECSGKPLLGRPVVVDWAVPVSTFKAAETEIKEEEEEAAEEVKVKEEPLSDDEPSDNEDGDPDDDDGDSDEAESDDSEEKNEAQPEKPKKVMSDDVSEGRTVFIKNVPFSVTNEELKTCMEQFGVVIYALVCTDPVTEHSRGTAFVKFQKKESAEECLASGTELQLHGQTLDTHRALNRQDVQRRTEDKQKAKKDSRNLYLVKEGVVVAGSRAASGVSMTDMAKRLQLEQSKSQLLRNLNMYVSPIRLVVYNVPPTWTDDKLRKLFQKHGGANAVVKEARLMRDIKNVDAEGIGKSKEFGFVSFTRHENALQALRYLNNNPDIFTPAKRPIVAFSIENRTILNLKQKRLERSQAKNPLCSNKKQQSVKHDKKQEAQVAVGESDTDKHHFVGVTSRPGNVKLRNKFKLQTQAKIHGQMVHKDKLKNRTKIKKQIAKEKIKQPQMKKGVKRKLDKEDGNFNALVNKYKQQLTSMSTSKWYEK